MLDVGCATGYFGRRLIEERGCRVIGIEADAHAAEEARAVCERVYTGDLNDRDFLEKIEERTDIVFFGDVIEHLPDPAIVLEGAHRWLNPGGQLICSVPNVAYWKIRYELMRGRFDYHEIGILDRTHLRFYTRRSFVQLLNETSYDVERVKPICSDPKPLSFRSVDPGLRTSTSFLVKFLLRSFPGLMATQFLYSARSGKR